MFEIASVVGSGILGSLLKIFAGSAQNIFDLVELVIVNLAKRDEERTKRYSEEFTVDSYTRTTRRGLAWCVNITFCIIALYCTYIPDQVITIIPGTGKEGYSLLWGLFKFPAKSGVVEVTTGAIAWAAINFEAMVLGFYFTPIGKGNMVDSLNIVISIAAILMAIINMLFGFILKRTWSELTENRRELSENRKELKEIYAMLADIRVSIARIEERGKVIPREN